MDKSQRLHGILTALISNDSTAVSFDAAVLLAKLGIVQETCVERLHKALRDVSPATQSLVSLLLDSLLMLNVQHLVYGLSVRL